MIGGHSTPFGVPLAISTPQATKGTFKKHPVKVREYTPWRNVVEMGIGVWAGVGIGIGGELPYPPLPGRAVMPLLA